MLDSLRLSAQFTSLLTRPIGVKKGGDFTLALGLNDWDKVGPCHVLSLTPSGDSVLPVKVMLTKERIGLTGRSKTASLRRMS
jgi:hypothetical protein